MFEALPAYLFYLYLIRKHAYVDCPSAVRAESDRTVLGLLGQSEHSARTVRALSSDSARTALLNLARVSAKESEQSPSRIRSDSARMGGGSVKTSHIRVS